MSRGAAAAVEIQLIAVRAPKEREQRERRAPTKSQANDAVGCAHGRDLNTKRARSRANQTRAA
jgi:hypothetical protein